MCGPIADRLRQGELWGTRLKGALGTGFVALDVLLSLDRGPRLQSKLNRFASDVFRCNTAGGTPHFSEGCFVADLVDS
jgi:hypothetical protein